MYARREPLPESGLTLAAQNVAVARKPPEAIPGALAAPGLMAQVIVSKDDDHLPLHRLEGIFKRQGLRISRQTMDGRWLQTTEFLQPLYALAVRVVLSSHVIHTDDTPVIAAERQEWSRPLLRSFHAWLEAEAPKVHFSLLASCKRHGHDPWVYFRDVLTAMLPAANEEELLGLLPHRWRPA